MKPPIMLLFVAPEFFLESCNVMPNWFWREEKSSLCLSAQLFGTSKILLMDWICHFFIQVFYPNWFSYRYIDFCQQALQFKGKLITSNSCIFSMNGKTISVWNWEQILCTQMLQNNFSILNNYRNSLKLFLYSFQWAILLIILFVTATVVTVV